MNEDPSKKRLGRGLAALIGEMDRLPEENVPPRIATLDRQVPIEFVTRNPRNPRRLFTEADLEDLTQSIREHGIVQPVVVRPIKDSADRYELIAGERRWRAAQRAGLTTVPVIIREVDDRVALELAIIENVQRADLNPIEEGMGYQQLIDDHDYTQADLAQVIGKSRSHVANTLRLLKLPETVRDHITKWRPVGWTCTYADHRGTSGCPGRADHSRRPVCSSSGSTGSRRRQTSRSESQGGQ